MDSFVDSFVECILWTHELDDYCADDLDAESIQRIKAECASFLDLARGLSQDWNDDLMAQAGHDFALTRDGHGCGFWSRPEIWGSSGAFLTDLAHRFPETYLHENGSGLEYYAM